jgi:hypothetical protein
MCILLVEDDPQLGRATQFNSTLLLIDKYSVSCSRKNVYLEDASLAK